MSLHKRQADADFKYFTERQNQLDKKRAERDSEIASQVAQRFLVADRKRDESKAAFLKRLVARTAP